MALALAPANGLAALPRKASARRRPDAARRGLRCARVILVDPRASDLPARHRQGTRAARRHILAVCHAYMGGMILFSFPAGLCAGGVTQLGGRGAGHWKVSRPGARSASSGAAPCPSPATRQALVFCNGPLTPHHMEKIPADEAARLRAGLQRPVGHGPAWTRESASAGASRRPAPLPSSSPASTWSVVTVARSSVPLSAGAPAASRQIAAPPTAQTAAPPMAPHAGRVASPVIAGDASCGVLWRRWDEEHRQHRAPSGIATRLVSTSGRLRSLGADATAGSA
jgi:hypothetical protein